MKIAVTYADGQVYQHFGHAAAEAALFFPIRVFIYALFSATALALSITSVSASATRPDTASGTSNCTALLPKK